MKKRSIIVVATSIVAMLGVWSTPAMAAPTGAKGATFIDLSCDNGVGNVHVVLNGAGRWNVGHVTTLNRVLVPYEFHIVGTETPVGGVTEPFIQDSVKNAPSSGRLTTCTWSESGSDAFGSYTIDGIAKASYTP